MRAVEITTRIVLSAVIAIMLSLFSYADVRAAAHETEGPAQILITNVMVWDGTSETRTDASSVLIEGNLIKQIALGTMNAPGATVIDGGGGTLMPGLIEVHAHLSLHGDLFQMRNDFNWMYLGAKSGAEATNMLMRGFTTARDAGGPVNGLRKVIDAGHVDGPRIYAAGPPVSQTGGILIYAV